MTDRIDDLVGALEPVEPVRASRLALRWVLPALLITSGGLAVWAGVRPDMPGALGLPSFWIKLVAMVAVALAGWAALVLAARPGRSPRRAMPSWNNVSTTSTAPIRIEAAEASPGLRSSEAKPKLATVTAISANTPIGA